jgi:hypothetical protein
VTIERYFRAADDWKPDPNSTVVVAAALRNQRPLAVERRIGAGRVMAFLTTFAPDWNDWGHDPSFVVMVLKLQSYLASALRPVESRAVGYRLPVEIESGKFRPELPFSAPGDTPETRIVIDRMAEKPRPNSPTLVASIGDVAADGVGETDRSGIYEAWLANPAGQAEVRRFALNVESGEGDLTRLDPPALALNLDPVKAEFRYADEYSYEVASLGGNNRSLLLMCLLIFLLVGEQAMAYSASYHPARVATGSHSDRTARDQQNPKDSRWPHARQARADKRWPDDHSRSIMAQSTADRKRNW